MLSQTQDALRLTGALQSQVPLSLGFAGSGNSWNLVYLDGKYHASGEFLATKKVCMPWRRQPCTFLTLCSYILSLGFGSLAAGPAAREKAVGHIG